MDRSERLKASGLALQACLRDHLLLLSGKDGMPGEGVSKACTDPRCPHRGRLRTTLLETVKALEGTRKAFKSKRIESLRRTLLEILAEVA